MCEKCNDTLITAANAANLLADAAVKLYNINQSAESRTLAEAAAELFTKVPEEPKTATSGETGSANGAQVSPGETVSEDEKIRRTLNAALPTGMYVTKDGKLLVKGQDVGLAVAFLR